MKFVSYCPKKGKLVTLLSTMHDQPQIDSNTEKKKPKMILDYNSTKAGVDTADQMARMYTVKRKSKRWPLICFYNIIDISAINSYVIWLHLNPNYQGKKTHKRRLFLVELGKALLGADRDDVQVQQGSRAGSRTVLRDPAPDVRPKLQGRCHVYSRNLDRKTKDKCIQCNKFVCTQHVRKLCSVCNPMV